MTTQASLRLVDLNEDELVNTNGGEIVTTVSLGCAFAMVGAGVALAAVAAIAVAYYVYSR